MSRSPAGIASRPNIARETLAKTGTSATAQDAATGQVSGGPVCTEIANRFPERLNEIVDALAHAYAAQLGADPLSIPLRAHVFSASRP